MDTAQVSLLERQLTARAQSFCDRVVYTLDPSRHEMSDIRTIRPNMDALITLEPDGSYSIEETGLLSDF